MARCMQAARKSNTKGASLLPRPNSPVKRATRAHKATIHGDDEGSTFIVPFKEDCKVNFSPAVVTAVQKKSPTLKKETTYSAIDRTGPNSFMAIAAVVFIIGGLFAGIIYALILAFYSTLNTTPAPAPPPPPVTTYATLFVSWLYGLLGR